ncbi:hypothetical protein MRB53_039905 [Persea americana]|nr:hypothetical protein MRB53_039905 [Persea americana]
MPLSRSLTSLYSWTEAPLVVGAPMRLISHADLATSVTLAGGLGFLGDGALVGDHLHKLLQQCSDIIGKHRAIGSAALPANRHRHLNHSADFEILANTLKALVKPPAAVWFFAPRELHDFEPHAAAIRDLYATHQHLGPCPHIWIQVGSVKEAVHAVQYAQPEVLVVQGSDAGGHGLRKGAGIVALLPEVADAVSVAAKEIGDVAGAIPS